MPAAPGNRRRVMGDVPRLSGEEVSAAHAWFVGPQDDECPFCGAVETQVVESRDPLPDFVYFSRIHQEDCLYVRYLNQAEELIYA
jgi:hypothetical protein